MPGPDLLRDSRNAIKASTALLAPIGRFYVRRQGAEGIFTEWKVIYTRFRLKRWLDNSLRTLADQRHVQIAGAQENTQVDIRARRFEVTPLTNATSDAEVCWALNHERFPAAQFGGCYVCKQVLGTNVYSDHAWGDAVDITENVPEVLNDTITDWNLRMAMEGQLPAEQIIGSKAGEVVSYEAPYWSLSYGGAESHLWHTHVSCNQHTGVPPCA